VYQDGKEVKGVWQEGALVTAEGQKAQGMSGEHEDEPLRKSMKQSELRVAGRRG
jgi:hypothetical protein